MRRRLQVAMVVLAMTTFVGACGGGDDDDDEPTTTVATSVATTEVTTPGSLSRLPEVFDPIPGFAYEELPASVIDDLQDQFLADPDTAEAVTGADGRSVTRNGEGVAVVIAVGFDRRSAALPGVEEGFISGATQDAVTTKELTLSGEKATLGTDADGVHTIAWLKGTLALVIIGDDEPTLTSVATALINNNK